MHVFKYLNIGVNRRTIINHDTEKFIEKEEERKFQLSIRILYIVFLAHYKCSINTHTNHVSTFEILCR